MVVAFTHAQDYRGESVRAAMRKLFELLGYDADNPLGWLVSPGDRVFIKPNWVAHRYRASCKSQDDVYSTITHPMVIRAVAEIVANALAGDGSIVIGDNPSIDADFDALMELAQLRDLESGLGVPCQFVDLRPLRCVDLKDYGVKARMARLDGDPLGSAEVDLGRSSYLYGKDSRLFRGVFTDRSETIAAHTGERHVYEFSNSILKADVYISLPKLKTHHKVGTTLNVKGLVGAVSNKNGLVHWRVGFPAVGGDEYPSLLAWARGHFQKVLNRGAWSGNDTIWRMAADLYNAMCAHGPRKCFSIVDGICGGERDGPFCPRAKWARTLIAGSNFLEVDSVATRLMGFDCRRVPYLRHLAEEHGVDFEQIRVISDCGDVDSLWDLARGHLGFQPPSGWPALAAARFDRGHTSVT